MHWKYRFPRWIPGRWTVLPKELSNLSGRELIKLLQTELRTRAVPVIRRVR